MLPLAVGVTHRPYAVAPLISTRMGKGSGKGVTLRQAAASDGGHLYLTRIEAISVPKLTFDPAAPSVEVQEGRCE